MKYIYLYLTYSGYMASIKICLTPLRRIRYLVSAVEKLLFRPCLAINNAVIFPIILALFLQKDDV